MSGSGAKNPNEEGPSRLYVIAPGHEAAADSDSLDLVTLIVSRAGIDPTIQPEHAAILQICRQPLSVAEISAYLGLPFSLVRVLVADLLTEGRVESRAPIPVASLPDLDIVEAVLHGLQRL